MTGKEVVQVIEGEVVETYILFDSNNSGGSFWLKPEQFLALERAGWIVHWGGRMYGNEATQQKFKSLEELPKHEYYMGQPAVSAVRLGLSLRDAILEWEKATDMDAGEAGCGCCGPPHEFTEYEVRTNRYVRSMNHVISSSWDA